MIWGHPIARMEEQNSTLELTRMFLFDSPKNSESKALSLAEKWIKLNRTEKRLIAYSDTRHIASTWFCALCISVFLHISVHYFIALGSRGRENPYP